MIRINLLSEGKAKKGKGAKVAVASTPGGPPPWLVPLGVVLLVVTLGTTFGLYLKFKANANEMTAENDRMKMQVDELQKYIQLAKDLDAQKAELTSRIDQIKALKNQQQGPVFLMQRLYETKPEDGVWFTEVKVDDPQVEVVVASTAPGRPPPAGAAPAAPAAPKNSVIHIKGMGINQTVVTQFVTQLEMKKDWFPRVVLKTIKAGAATEAGVDGREFELDVDFAPPVTAASATAGG